MPVTVIGIVQVVLGATMPPVSVTTLLLTATVPPQSEVEELGALMPVGSVSVKLIPVRLPGLLAGLPTTMFSVAVWPVTIVLGVKLLLIVGGPNTFNVAVAGVLFVPVSVVVSETELFFAPAVVPVTFTLMLHKLPAPAGRVAPVRLIEPELAAAVTVPPQVVMTFGVAATVNPPGSVSVKPTPVRLKVVSLLLMLKVSVVVSPTAIEVAPKLLVKLGAASTLSVAVLLAAPALAWVEVAPLVALVLAPTLVELTLKLIVQLPPAAMEPPL